jgi:hypothetical protein
MKDESADAADRQCGQHFLGAASAKVHWRGRSHIFTYIVGVVLCRKFCQRLVKIGFSCSVVKFQIDLVRC